MSGVGRALRIDPAVIRFRISPIADLHGVVGGDWDQARRYEVTGTVKHRAIIEHFTQGVPWEETDLFKDVYRRRLRTGYVRGETTFKDLVAQYYDRVDGMAESLRRDGFQTHREDGEPYPLPGLYIGRDGEIFIGNQGNHRLAIAQVLGLKKIIGRVVCTHALWG